MPTTPDPSLRDDLDDFLEHGLPDGAEPLALTAAEDVTRALRRLHRIRSRMAQVKDVARAETDRITAWRAGKLATLASQEAWVLAGLESFARAAEARDGSVTATFPTGTLRLRPAPLRALATDPDALRESFPDLVATVVPNLADVKARLIPTPEPIGSIPDPEKPGGILHVFAALDPATGQVVPGVEFVRDPAKRFTAQDAGEDQ